MKRWTPLPRKAGNSAPATRAPNKLKAARMGEPIGRGNCDVEVPCAARGLIRCHGTTSVVQLPVSRVTGKVKSSFKVFYRWPFGFLDRSLRNSGPIQTVFNRL